MNSNKYFLGVAVFLTAFLNSPQVSSQEQPKTIRFYSELVAPFYWLDDNDRPRGAALDLANALIEETNIVATVEHLPWARAFYEAINTPDVVLLTALKTQERSAQLQWLGKVHTANAYLIGLTSNRNLTINNLEQAKGYKVGTIRGYAAASYLRSHGFVEGDNLELLTQPHQLWSMLYKKRIDLVLSNLATGAFEIREAGLDPDLVHGMYQLRELTVNLEMATGKGTTANTANSLRLALSKLKQDGRFQTIMNKWNLY